MMKKSLYAGALISVTAILAGCNTTTEINKPYFAEVKSAEQLERCYIKDYVGMQRTGLALIESGSEFYFHPECDKHLHIGHLSQVNYNQAESVTDSSDKSISGSPEGTPDGTITNQGIGVEENDSDYPPCPENMADLVQEDGSMLFCVMPGDK